LQNSSGIKKALSILSILVFVCIIFYSTLHTGYESNKTSEKVALFIVNAISDIFNLPPVKLHSGLFSAVNTIVRKLAHFMEYFILCGLFYFAFRIFNASRSKAKLYSFISILSLACIDETVQSFVPGRDGKLTDILIDTSGALIALVIIRLFEIIASRKRQGVEKNH
jgi:VanZ family protein